MVYSNYLDKTLDIQGKTRRDGSAVTEITKRSIA